MGFTGGLIAVALAAALLFAVKARGDVARPFAQNWMALITVTMVVMLLFIGGLAALITNWP